MNHLDIFFIVIIGASILYSLIRGLVREIFSFLAIIFGFIGASYGYAHVAKWLGQWVHSEFIATLLGFLILLIAISLGISLMGRLLSGLVKKADLTWADRTGGAAFGFLKAVLLIAIFSLILTAFLPSKSKILSDSKIAPVALTIARGLAVVAPTRLQDLYEEKEKALRKYWASRELAGEKIPPKRGEKAMRIFAKSFAQRSLLAQSRGRSAFGCLVFLIVIGAVGYVGFKFGEAGWEYMDVRQKVREALNWAVANNAKTDAEMVQRISKDVREAGLELGPRGIRVTHAGEKLTFTVTWTRDVVLPYRTFPLHFKVSLTEIKRWTTGPLLFRY